MVSFTKLGFYGVVFSLGIYWLKQYMNGGVCDSTARLDDKVAIITGANTGVGKANTLDFIQRGAKVIMACRSIDRAQAAAEEIKNLTGASDERVVVMRLDLASMKSIRQFVEEFKAREKRLDILMNNAGLMWTPHGTTEDGFETQFGVNHLGHFLLTQLLAEMLIKSSPSRIINVSSRAQEWGTMKFDDLMPDKENYSGGQAYAQSKLANVLFSRELAKRLKGTGVTAYSVHPGNVKTELGRHFYFYQYPLVRQALFLVIWPVLKDPWAGAQTQICCAIDDKLADEKHSGKYFSDCKPKTLVGASRNEKDDKKLWDVSVKLVALKEAEIHPLLR